MVELCLRHHCRSWLAELAGRNSWRKIVIDQVATTLHLRRHSSNDEFAIVSSLQELRI